MNTTYRIKGHAEVLDFQEVGLHGSCSICNFHSGELALAETNEWWCAACAENEGTLLIENADGVWEVEDDCE